ncbi:MAG: hypothetical protein A4E42_00104 [Methanoregulaceae archaeon PtaU1.Bin222]|nr:MAG: hypothetical protein A4E42_00104 [Methanoregulaceae archaeon PtaU1.Bin222]
MISPLTSPSSLILFTLPEDLSRTFKSSIFPERPPRLPSLSAASATWVIALSCSRRMVSITRPMRSATATNISDRTITSIVTKPLRMKKSPR